MLTAILDGDIFAYEMASGAEEATNWGNGLWTLHAYEKPAIAKMVGRINEIVDKLKADEIVVALTDDVNWRKEVLPTYKGNRKDVRRPMILEVLKQYLRDNYKTYSRPTLEADDVCGILATSNKIIKGDKIVVTKDKDFKTFPAKIYFMHDAESGVIEVSPEEADKWHLMQTLAGDVTDGYAGCPSVGMETARKIVENPYGYVQYEHTFKSGPRKGLTEKRWKKVEMDNVWDAIVSHFEKAGLSEEEALVQARVARICRASDYDFKNKKVILWTPSELTKGNNND